MKATEILFEIFKEEIKYKASDGDRWDTYQSCIKSFLKRRKCTQKEYSYAKNILNEWGFKQVTSALKVKYLGTEPIRENILNKVIDGINIESNINVVLTSEGAGKSKLTKSFLQKFGVERVLCLFKSHKQLQDKKRLFDKFYPELKTIIIPGIERLLNKYGIKERVYVRDPVSGELYLSFKESVMSSKVTGEVKHAAFKEKRELDDVISGETKVDIILTTEKRFEIGVVCQGIFRNDVVIFDEFHADSWFIHKLATDKELKPKKKDDIVELFSQESWDNFYNKMYTVPERKDWKHYFKGKMIILSTEEKVPSYFKNVPDVNIVNVRIPFLVKESANIKYLVTSAGVLNKDNKQKVAMAFRANDYIVVGNGINSTENNVTILGQNKHEDWDGKKIAVLVTKPCPEEVAVQRANIPGISAEEAITMIVSDTVNQILGRCNGFRENVNIKEMVILVPKDLMNKIKLDLRYIAPVIRTMVDDECLAERIVHTMTVEISGFKKNPYLYLTSLNDKITKLVNNIIKHGKAVIRNTPSMKYFKWCDVLIERGKNIYEKMLDACIHEESYGNNSYNSSNSSNSSNRSNDLNIYTELHAVFKNSLLTDKIQEILQVVMDNPRLEI